MPYKQNFNNNERCNEEINKLKPPLKLYEKLRVNEVAYLPLVENDILFIPTYNGKLSSYSIEGNIIWEMKLSDAYKTLSTYNGHCVIDGNNIYAQYNNRLNVIDKEMGSLDDSFNMSAFDVAEYSLPDSVFMYPLMIGLFINKEKMYYGAIDINAKRKVWSHPFSSKYYTQILTASQDRVIVYENNEDICCLEIKTGSVAWRCQLSDIVKKAKIKEAFGERRVTGVPFVYNDNLYLAIEEGCVAAVSMRDGSIVWSRAVPGMKLFNMTFYDSEIYIVDVNKVVIIDAKNGKVRRQKKYDRYLIDLGFAFFSRLAVSDDYIFFADVYQGLLGAMDKKSLEVVWTYQLKAGIQGSPGPKIIDGRLYVLDIDSNLHVFEEDR